MTNNNSIEEIVDELDTAHRRYENTANFAAWQEDAQHIISNALEQTQRETEERVRGEEREKNGKLVSETEKLEEHVARLKNNPHYKLDTYHAKYICMILLAHTRGLKGDNLTYQSFKIASSLEWLLKTVGHPFQELVALLLVPDIKHCRKKADTLLEDYKDFYNFPN